MKIQHCLTVVVYLVVHNCVLHPELLKLRSASLSDRVKALRALKRPPLQKDMRATDPESQIT